MEPDELVYMLPNGDTLYFRRPDDAGALGLIRALVTLMAEPSPDAVWASWEGLAAYAVCTPELTSWAAWAMRKTASERGETLTASDAALWLVHTINRHQARALPALVALLAGLNPKFAKMIDLTRSAPGLARAA